MIVYFPRTFDVWSPGIPWKSAEDIIFQRRLNWETILQTDVASFMREATEATEDGEIIYGKPGYLGCAALRKHHEMWHVTVFFVKYTHRYVYITCKLSKLVVKCLFAHWGFMNPRCLIGNIPACFMGETAVGLVKFPITDMFAPLTDDSIPFCVSQL